MDTTIDSTIAVLDGPSPSRFRRTLRILGWGALGLGFLIVFTVFKLPEQRIKTYILGSIQAGLSTKGITLTAEKSSFSMIFGPKYTMEDVTLNFPAPQPPARIDSISVSPSIFSLLLGKFGGTIRIYNGDGSLKTTVKVKTGTEGPKAVEFSYSASDFDLGKSGILGLAAGINGSAILEGSGDLNINLLAPDVSAGSIRATLSKISMDPMSLQGFSIPKLSMSEGEIDIEVASGKATIKTVKLGKPGSQDDLIANVTGNVTLGRKFEASTLDLKAKFNLSQSVLKSFVLLDALLGAAKQSDGGYGYQITGPLTVPNPQPLKSQ